ncbi:MAG: hypothetical protein HY017_14630 [Betaproteobacteria bacterium]|nr:hypothetical protein [Betaproteobacteria bacterium]
MTGSGSRPVVFFGGGAVGSYIGGMLAASGVNVVLIDGWAAHVDAIRERGLAIMTPEGEHVARPDAWHLGDAHRLRSAAPAAVFLTVKLYDTAWASALLASWLPGDVPVVTLQNGLVEEIVAGALGWGRVLGGIGGGLDVFLREPGVVQRARKRWAGSDPVLKIGEVHGRRTQRAGFLAKMLGAVDHSAVTTDLWTHRWAKLCANAMTTGLSGLTGLDLREVYSREDAQRIAIRLAAEALALGEAMGFEVPALFGVQAATWRLAASGSRSEAAESMAALSAQASTMVSGGMSGTLQDLLKKRPTEVEFFNGYVAREARRHGTQAPAHAVVADLIRSVERGEQAIDPAALARIEAFASSRPVIVNPMEHGT